MSTSTDGFGSSPRRAIAVPELPPARAISRPKRVLLPNWALKTVMALTGTFLVFFLAMHLFGNLKVYAGPDSFDSYALWLRRAFMPLMPAEGVLWAFRAVLATCFVLHISAATILFFRGRRARGKFRAKLTDHRSRMARLMPVTGVLILSFLIFHLLDLTLLAQPVASAQATPGTPYANLVASLQRPWSAAIYLCTMLLTSIHVAHGVLTAANDLGAMGRRLRATVVVIGGLIALAILLGNASIPIAVLMGWVA